MQLIASALALGVFAASPARARPPAHPSPAPASEPASFAWPTPDIIEEAPVSGPMTAEGIPVRLRAVKLKHTLDELAPLYFDAYRKAGFYVPPGNRQFDMFRDPALTAFDPRHFISYTALFQKNPDGTTTVILGEANLGLARRTDVPPGFPMPSLAGKVSRFEMEGVEVLSYDVPLQAPEVETFYRTALGKLGFAPAEQDAAGPSHVFRKGGTEVELNTTKSERGSSVVVFLRHPRDGADTTAQAK